MQNITQIHTPLPADDLARTITVARPNSDASLRHLGVAGDTYTILLDGKQTNGSYCLIDMYVPPGGGPPTHRHDFEEMFTILEGEITATFRGEEVIVRAGETLNIPANAPHSFTNRSDRPARMLCTCTPAGQEEFFQLIGVPVETGTTPPPKPTPEEQAEGQKKAEALAPRFRTEMLNP